MLFAEAEGEPFDVYNSLTSLRDQGSLVTTNPVRVEQFGAHAMLQVNFYPRLPLSTRTHVLSLAGPNISPKLVAEMHLLPQELHQI